MRRPVQARLFVEDGDVAEQAGEDAPMDGAVARSAEGEFRVLRSGFWVGSLTGAFVVGIGIPVTVLVTRYGTPSILIFVVNRAPGTSRCGARMFFPTEPEPSTPRSHPTL